jgi:hypothetical protein
MAASHTKGWLLDQEFDWHTWGWTGVCAGDAPDSLPWGEWARWCGLARSRVVGQGFL